MQNVMVFMESIVSIICVSIVLGRIWARRCHRRPGPDTAIGKLIEHLVSHTQLTYAHVYMYQTATFAPTCARRA
jgi:hypothetical protein